MGDNIYFIPMPWEFRQWLIATYPCVLDFGVSCL